MTETIKEIGNCKNVLESQVQNLSSYIKEQKTDPNLNIHDFDTEYKQKLETSLKVEIEKLALKYDIEITKLQRASNDKLATAIKDEKSKLDTRYDTEIKKLQADFDRACNDKLATALIDEKSKLDTRYDTEIKKLQADFDRACNDKLATALIDEKNKLSLKYQNEISKLFSPVATNSTSNVTYNKVGNLWGTYISNGSANGR